MGDTKYPNLCTGARVLMGEHGCELHLRPQNIPNGLWSWRVYIDGNVHNRGPGSTRKDPLHYYALLLPGVHRIVVRDSKTNNPNVKESNTLCFRVERESEIIINIKYVDNEVLLEL